MACVMESTGRNQWRPIHPYSPLSTPTYLFYPDVSLQEKKSTWDCAELPSLGIIFLNMETPLGGGYHTLLTVTTSGRLKGTNTERVQAAFRALHMSHWLIPTTIPKSRVSQLTDEESGVQTG